MRISQYSVNRPVTVLMITVSVLVLGVIGVFIAEFANVVMFFLAGGLVGIIVGKLIVGVPVDLALQSYTFEGFATLIQPELTDLLWFIGGGIVFIIALDSLVILALTLLGVAFMRFALTPLQLMQPDWVIPGVIGLLGLMFQEGMRRRAKAQKMGIVTKEPVSK